MDYGEAAPAGLYLARLNCTIQTNPQRSERLRQLQMQAQLGIAGAPAPSAAPDSQAGSAAAPPAAAQVEDALRLALNQDLVACKVQLDSLARRLQLSERERDRASATLRETRARLSEADERLAQAEGELATSRALEARLQQRLVGAKTAAEVRSYGTRLPRQACAALAPACAMPHSHFLPQYLLAHGHQEPRTCSSPNTNRWLTWSSAWTPPRRRWRAPTPKSRTSRPAPMPLSARRARRLARVRGSLPTSQTSGAWFRRCAEPRQRAKSPWGDFALFATAVQGRRQPAGLSAPPSRQCQCSHCPALHAPARRCALRSLMAGGDVTLKAGRPFVELEQARAKEALARSALNRRCVTPGPLRRVSRAAAGSKLPKTTLASAATSPPAHTSPCGTVRWSGWNWSAK